MRHTARKNAPARQCARALKEAKRRASSAVCNRTFEGFLELDFGVKKDAIDRCPLRGVGLSLPDIPARWELQTPTMSRLSPRNSPRTSAVTPRLALISWGDRMGIPKLKHRAGSITPRHSPKFELGAPAAISARSRIGLLHAGIWRPSFDAPVPYKGFGRPGSDRLGAEEARPRGNVPFRSRHGRVSLDIQGPRGRIHRMGRHPSPVGK